MRADGKKSSDGGEGGSGDRSNWIEWLRGYRLVQVSLFQKPLVKIKLNDILVFGILCC